MTRAPAPDAGANPGVLLYEPRAGIGLGELEPELTRAFERIRAALDRGEAVVVALDDRHLQAVGDPVQAALAHGLLGLARALAVEGRKPGWRVSVLSAPPGVDPEERRRWVEQLAGSAAASGSLARLGGEHLGRVPV